MTGLAHLEVVEDREAFLRAQHVALSRVAYLLAGQDAAAQDLVQDTLVQVIVKWQTVSRASSPDAYVRRIMLNTLLAGRRRSWTRERPHAHLPDVLAADDLGSVDDRAMLAQALRTLPVRQRAAVVLRYYEDQTEAQTAAALGCSVGNVRSLTSRGLARLRADVQEAHS